MGESLVWWIALLIIAGCILYGARKAYLHSLVARKETLVNPNDLLEDEDSKVLA